MSLHPPRWIVFDWGDVLVRYRPRGMPKLARRLALSVDAVSAGLGRENAFDRLGNGDMTPEELFALIEQLSGVRVARDEFAGFFAEDVGELLPGAEELIEELAPDYRLAILSNTFFAHWDHLEANPFYDRFEKRMASHLLRASKPAREIYERALSTLGAPASEVAFVDDRAENVAAARDLGIRAIHSTSIAETRAALRDLGISLR